MRGEIAAASGANPHYDAHVRALERWLKPGALTEATARAFAEELALALCAAALRQTAPEFVFDGFCNARLDSAHRAYAYGAVTAKIDARALIDRARPDW